MVSVLRPGQRHINIPGIGVQTSRRAVSSAVDWWLAGGTITLTDVLEHIELPSVGQLYAGAAVASGQPWSIAARGIYPGRDTNWKANLFDSQTGRIILGVGASENGFYTDAWSNINLFPDTVTNYVWFLSSTGMSIQAYRNNVAIGAAKASTVGLATSGSTRWRNLYNGDQGALTRWLNPVPRAAVYKIALDATQRAALYTSMAA